MFYPIIYNIAEDNVCAVDKDGTIYNNQKLYNLVTELTDFPANRLTLITQGYISDKQAEYITNEIQSNNKTELYVYIDDIIREGSTEIETFKNLSRDTDVSIKYYICSTNNATLEKKYGIKLHYYDWFIITWALGSHHLLENYNIADKPTYKLSCLNNNCEQEHKILMASFVDKDTTMLTFQQPHLGEHFEKLINFKDKISKGNDELNQIGSNIYEGDFESTIEYISKAYVDITVESTFFIDHTHFSEKILKACLVKRPFIVVSGPKTLDVLKKLGFKTFWLWWNESYDNELDHYKRLNKIFELIEQIESMSYQELDNMLKNMEDVLEHNKQQLLMLDRSFKWLT